MYFMSTFMYDYCCILLELCIHGVPVIACK